jgi:microsomal dipeptidase-like Zn-dependent dipeptidase
VFPVHIADNGFGGTALYSEIFSFANRIISGQWWDVENCAVNADADPNNDIEFHLAMWDDINGAASFWNSLASLLGFGADVNITGTPPIPPAGSNCNKKGLTTLGDFLVDEMMKKGMIIDIDHSSAHSFDRILQLAAAERYPGISSGHTGFIEPGHSGAGDKTARHEGNKTPQQLDKLRAVGGIVAAILHQGKRNQVKAFSGSSVPFDCGESSQAWAHMYLYGVSKMQRVPTDRWPEDPVALGVGSDFNGLAGMPAPRYGGEACHGDTAPGYDANRAAGRIPYPFTPLADPGQSMDKMQIGNKIFDYNVDGLANVGMYPDFIRDLQANNMTPAQLAPFFNSAEMYIRAWERSEDNPAPGVSCDSPDGNWHATDVTLNCTAADVISFLENAADASFTLSTNVPAGTETANAPSGTRSNICDRRLNCTTGGPVTGNKIDKKAPAATIVEPSLSEYDYDAIVNVDVDATEGGSGVDTSTIGIKVDGVSKAEGFTLDMAFLGLGSHTVEFKVKDNVGNPTTVTKTFVVTASIDALIRLVERGVGKRAPILSPPPIEPMLESWLKTSLLSAKTAENLGSCSATKVNLLAFINKVKSGVTNGKITAQYGGILIAGANDKISRLGC